MSNVFSTVVLIGDTVNKQLNICKYNINLMKVFGQTSQKHTKKPKMASKVYDFTQSRDNFLTVNHELNVNVSENRNSKLA